MLSFVAASCDFSLMNISDQTFAKRPSCYPLRNNFNFTDWWWSGIFFRMNTVSAQEVYQLRIWAFIDYCENTAADNLYRYRFDFSIDIYSSVKASQSNEARIIFTDNKKIATWTTTFWVN